MNKSIKWNILLYIHIYHPPSLGKPLLKSLHIHLTRFYRPLHRLPLPHILNPLTNLDKLRVNLHPEEAVKHTAPHHPRIDEDIGEGDVVAKYVVALDVGFQQS
jgi:hypothetical protein